MKDFFDVWFLSQHFTFEGTVLAGAIRRTFEQRGTAVPTELPIALTPAFSSDPTKQAHRNAFAKRVCRVPAR
jgi:hypothetical protein